MSEWSEEDADPFGPSGDPGHSATRDPARPWGPGEPFGTEDAARIGLDRNTLEGAQLAFFSHLDARKPVHRIVAVVALLVLGVWPIVLLLNLLVRLL